MVYPLIRKYSHRHLTFSKDILKAFSGVLHACENLISPVRHFWGIPILPQENLVLESFNLGLSWDFSEIVILARLSRREGFPSWSWSGWDHPVSYREWYATRRKFFSPPELNVAIEIADGPTMSWIDIKQAVILGKHHLSRTKLLKVEAWTTMVKLRFITGAAEKPEDLASTTFTWAYASFCSEEYAWMVRAQVPILVNGADLNTWKDGRHTYALCTGILLGGIEKDDNQVDHPLLLVTKKGEFWERIGITYLIESFQMAPWRKEQKPVEKWIRYWLQIQREVIYLI
jgi:hypothetical protein